MMAAGLEKQLLRCSATGDHPNFCNNTGVYGNVLKAYNHLWDSIEANQNQLRTEVWSWVYNDGFMYTPLGDIPGPHGGSQTESNIVQVISFVSVTLMGVVVESDGGFFYCKEFSVGRLTSVEKQKVVDSFVYIK
jgi:hypothetical protein